jgi:hypothetical protein
MGELRGNGDFAMEAPGSQRASQLGGEHLDRDETVVFSVTGEVDRSHRASTELPLDLELVREKRPKCCKGVRQLIPAG